MSQELIEILDAVKAKDYLKVYNLLLNIPKEQVNSEIEVAPTQFFSKKTSQSLLQFACSTFKKERILPLVKSLIDKGANINYENDDYRPVIFRAIRDKNYELVKLLIEHGVDVNHVSKSGSITPLIRACKQGDCIPVVRLLIESGANVNYAAASDGKSPLLLAMEIREPELAKLLIEHDADVKAVNKKGDSAITLALDPMYDYDDPESIGGPDQVKNEMEVIKLLIAKGADINAKNIAGRTLIMMAVRKRDIELIKLLLKNGATVDIKDPAWGELLNQDNNDCVKYIKKICDAQPAMPFITHAARMSRDNKPNKQLTMDLSRKLRDTLSGDNTKKPGM